jgi:hypothetical protein
MDGEQILNAHIAQLGVDVWRKVLRLLPWHTLVTVSSVCHFLREVANAIEVWEGVFHALCAQLEVFDTQAVSSSLSSYKQILAHFCTTFQYKLATRRKHAVNITNNGKSVQTIKNGKVDPDCLDYCYIPSLLAVMEQATMVVDFRIDKRSETAKKWVNFGFGVWNGTLLCVPFEFEFDQCLSRIELVILASEVVFKRRAV